MPLESLLILALGGLRAYIMILIFRRSQVPTLLPQSSQPQRLKLLQQVKLFQLRWKSQQMPIKTLVKERGLWLPRIRRQMLLLLNQNKLLTTKLQRRRLRMFTLILFFFLFYVYRPRDLYYALIINEDVLILFYALWQVMASYSSTISFSCVI